MQKGLYPVLSEEDKIIAKLIGMNERQYRLKLLLDIIDASDERLKDIPIISMPPDTKPKD